MDKLTEIEAILFDICRDEETANAELAVLREASEEKAAIKDGVTNTITSGAGRKGLSGMAESLLGTKPDSIKYKKFSMGFGNPTSSSSSSSSSSTTVPESAKKRKRDADSVDSNEMAQILTQFSDEATKDEAKDKRVLEFMESSSRAMETSARAIQALAESTAASNAMMAEMMAKSILSLFRVNK